MKKPFIIRLLGNRLVEGKLMSDSVPYIYDSNDFSYKITEEDAEFNEELKDCVGKTVEGNVYLEFNDVKFKKEK